MYLLFQTRINEQVTDSANEKYGGLLCQKQILVLQFSKITLQGTL